MSVAIAVRGDGGQIRHLPEPLNGFRPATIHHRGHGRKTCKLDISGAASEPSRLAIEKQLLQIIRSEQFVRAQRMRRFLAYIVEEALAGRQEQISEYSIGIAVFDRGEAFEPGLDPIVRNEARRLRQKLSEYYQKLAFGGHRVLIEIPKGRYVPAFRLTPAAGGSRETLRISLTVSSGRGPARTWEQEYRIGDQNTLRIELEVTGCSLKEVEAAGSDA